DLDGHVIGFGPRALNLRLDRARIDVHGQHLALARVGAAAAQAGADVEALQDRDPAPGPPALAEGALPRLGPDAAPGLARPRPGVTGKEVSIPHRVSLPGPPAAA